MLYLILKYCVYALAAAVFVAGCIEAFRKIK